MKNFECDVCKQEYKTARDLKIHNKTHRPNISSFKYEICEKLFDENWKMMAHKKTHHGNSCDKCEKTFRNENILKKHKQISHENVRLYCTFFNNDKECPFAEECIFLHEKAGICRYGELCERENCMFEHNVSEEVEEQNDGDECEESVVEDPTNKTFFNPSQSINETVNQSVDNIIDASGDTQELSSDKLFKCELCDFRAARKNLILDHKGANHNWCSKCYSSFNSEDELKNHIKSKHRKKQKLTALKK